MGVHTGCTFFKSGLTELPRCRARRVGTFTCLSHILAHPLLYYLHLKMIGSRPTIAFAVVVAGKGTNKKTTLYVGGLEENVNEAILHSAFIPFGDIKDVNIPMDNTTGKHRGFGFVEYENAEVSLQLSS